MNPTFKSHNCNYVRMCVFNGVNSFNCNVTKLNMLQLRKLPRGKNTGGAHQCVYIQFVR